MSDWGATQRVMARVVLAEGVVLAGDLHLLQRAYPSDRESPLEMLNRDEPFFALTLGGEGGVVFVSKAQVAVVGCQDLEPVDDPERASAAKLVALSVEMTDGVEYQGRATFELPPNRARALDYVNGAGRFFTLWTDGMTQYINKSLVRKIRPLD